MLKVHFASLGSNAGANELMTTALQNGFFSSASPDRRMIETTGDADLSICETRNPVKYLALEGVTEPGESRVLSDENVRDKARDRIRSLAPLLETLKGDMKVKVQNEITKLETQVENLNLKIATELMLNQN